MQEGFFYLLLCCAMLAGCGEASRDSELQFWSKPKAYDWHKNLSIRSFDGTVLKAQLMTPNPQVFPGARPAVIFVNSWTLNEFEYTAQALRLAEKGYIVLSYATRGFGGSGGVVSAASPNDIRDVSHLIDWLGERTNLDPSKIGMSGVSYGGGISLLALAHDERIATVVALSGWADLEQALYGDETIRKVWIELLIGSGAVTGRLDPDFINIYRSVRSQTDLEYFSSWAEERSAIHLVDRINERQAPIFMANNYDDQLFPPNQMWRFFEKLTGPKKFVVNQGIHASAEIGGILGLPSRIWDDTIRWFDYWLYEDNNGIFDEEPISMERNGRLEFFQDLPRMQNQDVNVNPLNRIQRARDASVIDLDGFIPVRGGRDSGATSGIPILSSIIDAHTPMPIRKKISRVNQNHGAIYQSERLQRSMQLRGMPRVELWLKPKSHHIQLAAYLYQVDWRGWGELLTHGVMSLRNLPQDDEPFLVEFDLNTLSENVNRGQRLTLVIDTIDPLYEPTARNEGTFDLLHGGEFRTKLYVPDMSF